MRHAMDIKLCLFFILNKKILKKAIFFFFYGNFLKLRLFGNFYWLPFRDNSCWMQSRERSSFNAYVDFVFISPGQQRSLIFILFLYIGFFWTRRKDVVVLQHYDRRGQYDISLAKIDEAIEHTPTVIDLYSVKVCLFDLIVKVSII